MSATNETTRRDDDDRHLRRDAHAVEVRQGRGGDGRRARASSAPASAPGGEAPASGRVPLAGHAPSPDPTQPSSWLDINADNTITMRTGIAEMGQGSASTAFAMIAAEELNVPYSAITQVVIGDTDRTPDGGIAAGYMCLGAPNVRNVAAYVYQALLSLASTQLGVPVANLTVTNGVDLGRRQERQLRPARLGAVAQPDDPGHRRLPNELPRRDRARQPRRPSRSPTTRSSAQSIPMRTIPPIVTGTATYVGDVRLPGMLHARAGASARARREPGLRSGRSTRRRSRTRRSSSRATSSRSSTRRSTRRSRRRRSSRGRRSGRHGRACRASDNLFGAMRSFDWTSTPPALGVERRQPETRRSRVPRRS